MLINKIKAAFDKGAITYDNVAHIQKEAAHKLVSETLNFINNVNINNIIDIAAGTGYVTASLLDHYPHAHYTVNDMSAKMLEITKKKFVKFDNIVYTYDDANNLDLSFYDLAISNMSFQWFTNLPDFLQKLFNHTKILAFSTLTEKNFASWYKVLAKFNIAIPTQFYTAHELEKICLDIQPRRYNIFNASYPIELPNALAMSQYLKKLGANVNTGNDPSIKKLFQDYQEPIKTSYEVFFAILER